jgi:phosphoribosylamine--glycine ligase
MNVTSDPGRILVIGSGGREHALAWRLKRDPGSPEVLLAPGNPGIASSFECLPLDPLDSRSVSDACRARDVDLVVVGPEAPLAAGLADRLQSEGRCVFGPGCQAARLESSKWFAKQIMAEAGVPTARAEAFESLEPARAALARFAPPWVIKADGLAAGKGVRVTSAKDEALAFLAGCLEAGQFGPSGRRVVIEEFLAGEEASVMAVADGERFTLLPAARDFKRAFDGDAGPNTGGMGAFAPHPRVDPALEAEVGRRIVAPVLDRMRARGTPYRGALYCGLMIGAGGPRVVEFNARFGDPESEVVLPLVEGSLAGLLESAARGSLAPDRVARASGAAVSVALTDSGYPSRHEGRGRITGLDALGPGLIVFHGSTEPDSGAHRVSGGRACFVTALGEDVERARSAVYAGIGRLGGSGWRCRRDIAAPVTAGAMRGTREA